MASYSTKRVQVDFPESWIPEIDHEKEIEDRSRHNMILRLVREALDARASARMTLRLKDWHKPAVVYRLFDADGDLLYIGVTSTFGDRVRRHAAGKPWWSDVRTITLERVVPDEDDDGQGAEQAYQRSQGGSQQQSSPRPPQDQGQVDFTSLTEEINEVDDAGLPRFSPEEKKALAAQA